jgi:tetratricopeptide (TPR) repeat protein/tRNA A-37 threonylcarbamoyl transferase component Bud32
MRTCAACGTDYREVLPLCPHCGAEAPDVAPADAGDALVGRTLVRKFRILSVLGEGGMGRVYKAEQLPLGTEVVIKTLHAHMAADAVVVKRFFREAQSASRLRHPNSIGILDFGDADGTLYIAMEYLRGRSLEDVLAQDGRFSPERLRHVIGQVLDVLEAAHRLSIVHRDLKPANIMVEDLPTQRDFVKVLDFGIAKIIDPIGAGGTRLTATGMVFGTPAYMSPEQAMARDLDARSDLYSVGVIAFELLTGRLPFEADNAAVMLAAHASTRAPPIGRIRPDLPRALAGLVDRLLAKDPNRRPRSALELKDLLLATEEARAAGGPSSSAAPSTRALDRAGGIADAPAGLAADKVVCQRCGAEVTGGAKFCGDCGAPTARTAKPSGLGDKLSDLRRFLPSGLVDELADLGVRGAGEKREIAIAVVDLGGGREGGDDEAAARALADLYHTIGDLVARRGGMLERRADTGARLLFGLAAAHADDAERAVLSALELRTAVREWNLRHDAHLHATIAVHIGTAVVEATDAGPSYRAIGDTLELPTRLAAATGADKIVVSDRVRQQVRGRVKLRGMSPVKIKGKSAAVASYEVLGEGASEPTAGPTLATPPLCGRQAQMNALLRLVDEIEHGAFVHVVGEPGAGKSRFLAELRALVSQRQCTAVLASADGGAIARVLQALVSISGGGLGKLGLGQAEARLLGPYLGAGAAVSGAAIDRPALPEPQLRAAVVAVVRKLLEAGARVRPLCLLIDDAHLADPATAALLHRLADEPVPRTLVAAAARPGYAVPWEATRTAAQTAADKTKQTEPILRATMAALDAADLERLVDGVLAPTPAPSALKQAVVARAGGLPLMALEVLRSWVDAGLLAMVGGAWQVTGDLAAAPRPEGLRALYAARLDALPAYARDVLTCASVIGQEFSIDLVDRIIAQARGAPIDREIELLVERGILRDGETPAELRFAEPSAREAVYERLVKDAKQHLHRAVAIALADGQDAAPVAPETIGEHYLRGGEMGLALEWLGGGAEAALANGALSRAARILRLAREAARRDLDGPDAIERTLRLARDSLALGRVLLDLGDLSEVREILTEGLSCARRVEEADLLCQLRQTRGRASMARGDVDEALRDLEAAVHDATGLGDRVLLAHAHGDLGELLEKRGDLGPATEHMMKAIELCQAGSSTEVRQAALRLLTALGRVSLRQGSIDRAQRFLQQALTLAEELDDRMGAAKVVGNLAGVYHARRDFQTARTFVERALEIATDAGDQLGAARQLNNLGTLDALLGDTVHARAHYDAAYAAARLAGWREGMATAAAGRDRLPRA